MYSPSAISAIATAISAMFAAGKALSTKIRQYERLGMAKVHPAEEVNLAASGYTVLTVGQKGIALELGRAPFARKLAMAAEVVGELAAKGRTPGLVFLDNEAHPERVVVRMR